MSVLLLKIIALVSMTIDHIGFKFWSKNIIFRIIGRLAFPIYCFLLVEGFFHTKHEFKKLKKYFFRILFFAIVSEIPYNLFVGKAIFYPSLQNVLFTLASSIILLILLDKYSKNTMLQIFYILIIMIINMCLFLEYSILGPLYITLFYLYRQKKEINVLLLGFPFAFLIYTIFNIIISYDTAHDFDLLPYLCENWHLIIPAFLSVPIIAFYNNKLGYNNKLIKYIFYIYYPLHILILLFISLVINNNI